MTNDQERTTFLDRPLFKGSRISWFMVLYVAVFVFVVFTRLWDLGGRAYSHDESIHAWMSWKYITGQGYQHNPVYHGPFLYTFTAFIFSIFGDTDFTARLGAALFGIGITLVPLLLKEWLGKKGALLAALFMAISPVLMTRSRYIRHDQFVALFNLLLLVASLRYLAHRKPRDLYLAAAMISLGFTAKETTFITYFIFGVFLFAYWLYHLYRMRPLNFRQAIDLPVFDLMAVMVTLILPLASPFVINLLGMDSVDYTTQLGAKAAIVGGMIALSALLGILWNRKKWLVSAGIFWAIFIPLFTSMFTNPVEGLATGIVGQLGYWLSQQGVKRGNQPGYYYALFISLYEFLPLILALCGIGVYAAKGDRRQKSPQIEGLSNLPSIPFVPLLIVWFVLTFVMYSWAGEKMPWLMIHIAIPMQLLAGWTAAHLFETDWKALREKGGLWLLLLVPMLLYVVYRLLSPGNPLDVSRIAQQEWMRTVVTLIGGAIVIYFMTRILSRLSRQDGWRMVGLSLFSILAAVTLRFAFMASFSNAAMATEYMVYAQGTPDVALVADELEELSERLTGDLHLTVAYDNESSWPFEWYLRDFDNRILFTEDTASSVMGADVILVSSGNQAAVSSYLGTDYYVRDYRLIWWPNQDTYFNLTLSNVWDKLTNAESREQIWNIIWSREYTVSTDNWPLVSRFSMYIRRDIAQQLWDYGIETASLDGTLPGDEYLDLWESVDADVILTGSADTLTLSAPKDVDIDAEGNIYIAEGSANRVTILSSEGIEIGTLGSSGSELGQFSEPWGIAVADDGTCYVADTWNGRIQVFDPDGTLVNAWGQFGQEDVSGSGYLLYGPRDIVLDEQGNVYVADTGNKRIVKYNADGDTLAIIGGSGSDAGQFQEPVGLAIGPDGYLYVVDTWNHRVQVFDDQLRYVREWTIYSWEGTSVVNKPYIAVDDEGHVFVSDPEDDRILEFDGEGNLVRTWGQTGSGVNGLNQPTGVALSDDGTLYVCDTLNNRVLGFK